LESEASRAEPNHQAPFIPFLDYNVEIRKIICSASLAA
jgi:hypothetical protein